MRYLCKSLSMISVIVAGALTCASCDREKDKPGSPPATSPQAVPASNPAAVDAHVRAPDAPPPVPPITDQFVGRDLPNAILGKSYYYWAKATSETDISRLLLKHLTAPRAIEQPDLVLPVCSADELIGLDPADLVRGVFRKVDSAKTYSEFLNRKDRPLSLNWVEDIPKVVLAQTKHYGGDVSSPGATFLRPLDLAGTLRGDVADEFDLHRLEKQYEDLEQERRALFVANLGRGPAFAPETPVVFAMEASLGKYDFENGTFQLKNTPPDDPGCILYMALDKYVGPTEAAMRCCLLPVFDPAPVGRYGLLRRSFPLNADVAEKLRKQKCKLIVFMEGQVGFDDNERPYTRPNSPEYSYRSVLLDVSRIRFIAVPPDGKMYEAASLVIDRSVTASASYCSEDETPQAMNLSHWPSPTSSSDGSTPRMTWWPHRGTSEWVQYEFDKPRKVSGVEVYWFDNTGRGRYRVPRSWRVEYRQGTEWKPVNSAGTFGVEVDKFNTTTFDPIETTGLRLVVDLQPEFSGGVLRWRVK